MTHFFPKRKLTIQELSLIPEALFYLISARLEVNLLPSKYWLPNLDKIKDKREKTKVENPAEKQQSRITNHESQITPHGLNDCKTVPARRSGFRPASQSSTGRQDHIIAKVINGLAARTPWPSTCLIKALAVHKMLSRRHIHHSIHFGVNIDPASGMKAHAWLSVGDEIIIGGENLGEFKEVGSYSVEQ